MWCIGELAMDYERTDAGFIYGVVDTPAYRTMNPNGTVPVVRDGNDPPLWETGAILRYLGQRYAADDFWPTDPVARARVDMWAEWAKINVAMNFTSPVFWRVARTPAAQRDPVAIEHALATLGKYLDIAEAQLADSAHLAGQAFTLADIQFGHCLFRYFDIDIARKDRPALRRYYDALTVRPAFREHVMVSYDELRDRPG
jgi:glutathione S-transferase